MRAPRILLTAALCAVAAGSLAPAQAAPMPKPFSGSTTYTDMTPDPSGGLGAQCNGATPPEKPITLKIAHPGVVKVSLSDFTGDWALVVNDKDGKFLGDSDTTPPATENVIVTLKKPVTLSIQPCNVGGTVTATVSWSYRYKKP